MDAGFDAHSRPPADGGDTTGAFARATGVGAPRSPNSSTRLSPIRRGPLSILRFGEQWPHHNILSLPEINGMIPRGYPTYHRCLHLHRCPQGVDAYRGLSLESDFVALHVLTQPYFSYVGLPNTHLKSHDISLFRAKLSLKKNNNAPFCAQLKFKMGWHESFCVLKLIRRTGKYFVFRRVSSSSGCSGTPPR